MIAYEENNTLSLWKNHEKVKAAFTTRRVDFTECCFCKKGRKPANGDLVLARVRKIGQHHRIELANGRKSALFPGDEIVVAYGNRYAPDQFGAMVPEDLSPCHLVAAGGIASRMFTRNNKMKMPTLIEPIGILTDSAGVTINVGKYAMRKPASVPERPLTLAVAGTSMNAGKTTTVASLIRGLSRYGLKVGAAKVTGTGAGGDLWFMKDCGAALALDFVDAGYPATYLLSKNELIKILDTLISCLTVAGADVIVLEIADGLYEEETATLLSSSRYRSLVDGIMFASSGAMAARGGVQWLRKNNIEPLAISGVFTQSPPVVAILEKQLKIPVLRREELADPAIMTYLALCFPGHDFAQNTPQTAIAH